MGDPTPFARNVNAIAAWGRGPMAQRWLPAALYAALTLVLFRGFVASDEMLFGTDTVTLGYFARRFFADSLIAGHTFPLWNPFVQGGLPFVDAMHGDVFYPTTLLSFVMPVHRALGWKLVMHVILAGLFMHLWLRRLGVSRGAALWGGAAYLLAPVLVSLVYAGHDGKLFVTALAPLAFWATDRAVEGRKPPRYAALALIVALLLFTAHMQLAYFAVWGVTGWALHRLFGWKGPAALVPILAGFAGLRTAVAGLGGIGALVALTLAGGGAALVLAARRPALRDPLLRLGLFAAAGLAGAGVAAVQLVPPACYLGGAPRLVCGEAFAYSERVAQTTRAPEGSGYEYATSWSLHPEEALALLVPEFVGLTTPGGAEAPPTYWGRNPFKLNHEYAGLIGLLLAPIMFLRRRGGSDGAPFWGALAAVALIYALGATTPLFRAFYVLVPGVPLFRAPASAMFLFAFAIITLGALAVDRLRERAGDPAFARLLRIYLGAVVGACAVLAVLSSAGRVLPDVWTALLYRDITPQGTEALAANLAHLKRGFWLTLILAALTAALVWGVARGRLTSVTFATALLFLTGLDEWRVDRPFIRTAAPAALFGMDDGIWYLKQQQWNRPVPFRVFSALLPDDNRPALHGLEQVQGQHGNAIARYTVLTTADHLAARDLRLLKLLNAEFVLSPEPLDSPGLVPVAQGGARIVYRLEGAFPRAFLVGDYEVAPDSVAIGRLFAPDFDPSHTALLERALPPAFAPQSGATGTVRWIARGVNRQRLEVEASAPALLVVSDNYHPAWHARIDDQPVALLRGDVTLRALPVPAGRHQVEFVYQSNVLRWSIVLSLAAAVFVLAVLVARRA